MILKHHHFLKKFKSYIFICTLLIGCFLLVSNSAQPGIWNAGGSGSFKLLYPEDSIAYKKIQMQSESIYIQLHKGFAIVKGNYNFYNSTDSIIKIKVGYPINNVFPNENYQAHLNEVFFDDLYKIKGSLNGSEIPLFTIPSEENDNWYVWELSFPPKQSITFTVHFIVNTNNAQILQGYNKDYKNAFIYLIETGSIWKSPIENGDFFVQLKDNVTINDLKGSAPSELFYNETNKVLFFNLKNYGITPDDNLILTYGNAIENFDFEKIITSSNLLFKEIDEFSKSNSNLAYSTISLKNPYDVKGAGNFLIGSIYFLFIYGIPILIGMILLYFVYRMLKNKKTK